MFLPQTSPKVFDLHQKPLNPRLCAKIIFSTACVLMSDSCPPCLLTVPISCRCGRSTVETLCHQGHEEPPQCFRVCKSLKSCSRHQCGERCCPGERKAIERLATKRKLKPLGVDARMLDENIEPEHICTKTCSKILKCQRHRDPNRCHKGPCESCKEAIFEDISCRCGRTVLP